MSLAISSIGAAGKLVDLKQAIQRLDALPAMPVIAQKLLALNFSTDEGERQMLVLIEQDPQITAKIIGLSNSALFAVSRRVATLRDAIMLLGIKRVRTVSAGIAIMSLMAKSSAGRLSMQDLWLHSFGVAFGMLAIARAMPQALRPQDDHTFLAGLLHDIGYLALAHLDPATSDRLHNALAADPQRPALEIERQMLPVCHDELGAELARHWNLPDEIIAILRYHHLPDEDHAMKTHPLVRMVSVVERLLPSFGINENVVAGIRDDEWEMLGLSPDQSEELSVQVAEQAEQALQFVNSIE